MREHDVPEVATIAFRRRHTAARLVVESYGGVIEKSMGDAFVGVVRAAPATAGVTSPYLSESAQER